jgi:hypothetical protein
MTLTTIIAVRLGLWREPFSRTRVRLLEGLVVGKDRDDPTARRIFRAVRVISCLVPGATCLTQALAAQVLLTRHELDSTIVLGVRQDASGRMKAHAWLYYDGKIALGGPPAETSGFVRLASFGPSPQ